MKNWKSVIPVWHNEAHERLIERIGKDVEIPGLVIEPKRSRRLGFYRPSSHVCYINASYASLMDEDQVRETVFHEVAHGWQKKLMKKSAHHGDLWRWLMLELGYRNARAKCVLSGHEADMKKIGIITKMLKLQAKANAVNAADQFAAALKATSHQSVKVEGSRK